MRVVWQTGCLNVYNVQSLENLCSANRAMKRGSESTRRTVTVHKNAWDGTGPFLLYAGTEEVQEEEGYDEKWSCVSQA